MVDTGSNFKMHKSPGTLQTHLSLRPPRSPPDHLQMHQNHSQMTSDPPRSVRDTVEMDLLKKRDLAYFGDLRNLEAPAGSRIPQITPPSLQWA